MTTVTAERSTDLMSQVGVNTHSQWPNAVSYSDAAKTLGALRYLGVNLVRDSLVNPSQTWYVQRADYLANAGVKMNLGMAPNYDSPATSIKFAHDFEARHPGV